MPVHTVRSHTIPSHTPEVLLQVIQQARRQNLGCGRQGGIVCRGCASQVRRGLGQVCTDQIVGLRFQGHLLLLQKGLCRGQLVDRVAVEDTLAGQRIEGSAKLVGRRPGSGRSAALQSRNQLLQRAETSPAEFWNNWLPGILVCRLRPSATWTVFVPLLPL